MMMTGPGETTESLLRRRSDPGRRSTSSGVFQAHPDFGPNPGQLRLLLHIPKGLPPGAPLVVLLHGCGQSAEAFARQSGWLELADRLGFVLLTPEQAAANNPNRCFNWFAPGDIQRGQGEAASIAELVAFVARTFRHGRKAAFITGLSAGGAMAAVMLATYPELFQAGAVVAGLPYGVAHGAAEALRVMSRSAGRDSADLADLIRRAAPATAVPPRLSIWHGDADMVVQVANARDLARQWAAAAGLQDAPDATVSTGRRSRSVWRDRSGAERVELNLVRGLGHGVPLSTMGVDGLGASAPFMLEAGVSSSLEIARFWGLEAPGAADAAMRTRADREMGGELRSDRESPANVATNVGIEVLSGLKAIVPAEVEAVIANALRAAGLLR